MPKPAEPRFASFAYFNSQPVQSDDPLLKPSLGVVHKQKLADRTASKLGRLSACAQRLFEIDYAHTATETLGLPLMLHLGS